MAKTCLLIVDVQNDFCPGGALSVREGDRIVPVINRILPQFELVIATRDTHPEQTVHFENWPPHCIAGTVGADFHPDLNVDKIHFFADTGTSDTDDGYSGFDATNMDLAGVLQEQQVEKLVVCGLATDYCVKATALDAVKHGFHVTVLTDCIRAVNLHANDGESALSEMTAAGVHLSTSGALRRMLNDEC
ncbi:MAG: isochorismatase family protein [Holophagae bacterium]|nr:isochorismatase family protein [Holophagae bacterium]